MAIISFMLLMPFVTYLVAEDLKVSGVIAVVILGLGIARFSDKVPRSVHGILSFAERFDFILIGLQLPHC